MVMSNAAKAWLKREHGISLSPHAAHRIEEMEIPMLAVVGLTLDPDVRYAQPRGRFVHQAAAWPAWALVVSEAHRLVITAVFREQQDYRRNGSTYEVGGTP